MFAMLMSIAPVAFARPIEAEKSAYGSFIQFKTTNNSQDCALGLRTPDGKIEQLLTLKSCNPVEAIETMGTLSFPTTGDGVEFHVFTVYTDESQMRCDGLDTIVIGLSNEKHWAVRAAESCSQPSQASLRADSTLALDIPATTTNEGQRFEIHEGKVTEKIITTLPSKSISTRTITVRGTIADERLNYQNFLAITPSNGNTIIIDHLGKCVNIAEPVTGELTLSIELFDDKREETTCLSMKIP